jgi:hypothetical protein
MVKGLIINGALLHLLLLLGADVQVVGAYLSERLVRLTF